MNTSMSLTADPALTRKIMEVVIRIGIVVLLALWSFQIFSPFLGPLVWGIIIAVAGHGGFSRLKNMLGGRGGLAATLFALLALAVLITPTVFLSQSVLTSAQGLAQQLEAGDVNVPAPPDRVAELPVVGKQLYDTWSLASSNLDELVDDFQPQIRAFSGWLLGKALGTGVDILLFVLSIIIGAALLANAEAGARLFRALFVRLADERGNKLLDLCRDTILSVVRGVLGIALIQTFFLAVGLFFANVPAAGLLSVIALLFAIAQIPMLLLFLPIIIFVFATADAGTAIPFAIWSVFFSFADGFLKPLMLGRGLEVPMPVILIGVVGGMLASGLIGLFVGPIVLGLSYALFIVWLEQRPPPPGGQGPA